MASVYRNNFRMGEGTDPITSTPSLTPSKRVLAAFTAAALLSALVTACTPATGPDTVGDTEGNTNPGGQEPAQAAAPLPELATLYQSGQCGDITPGIHLLEDQAALDRFTGPGATLSLDGQRRPGPQADFDHYHVLLISEGQRSTGGYAIQLNDDGVRLAQGTVVLPVDFIHPEAGGLVTQAITSPCLVVTLTRGEWSEVQAGPYRLSLD